MVEKYRYYSEISGVPLIDCAPTEGVLTPPHADAINAIADDDPAFLAWQESTDAVAELKGLTADLSQSLEDLVNVLLNKSVITGNEPIIADLMDKLTRKVAARNKV